jgi:RNA polymerase sigma-70 factor (ECF subfamily)
VRRVFSFALSLDQASEKVAEDGPRQDEELAEREDLERLSAAIASLPAALREPLVLHVFQGLSQAETAAALAISEKAVETRLYRARAKLAAKMNAE